MYRLHNPASRPAVSLAVFGCLLVLGALLAQFSVWPVYQIQRHAARNHMKHRLLAEIPVGDLSEFRFTPAEFENIEFEDGGKEMERDGFLYDLVRVERIADGSIVVHAIRDDRETKVLATLDALLGQLEENDKQGKDQRTDLVSSWAPYCEQVPTIVFFGVARDRGFPVLACACGRSADAIEPSPPRAA